MPNTPSKMIPSTLALQLFTSPTRTNWPWAFNYSGTSEASAICGNILSIHSWAESSMSGRWTASLPLPTSPGSLKSALPPSNLCIIAAIRQKVFCLKALNQLVAPPAKPATYILPVSIRFRQAPPKRSGAESPEYPIDIPPGVTGIAGTPSSCFLENTEIRRLLTLCSRNLFFIPHQIFHKRGNSVYLFVVQRIN